MMKMVQVVRAMAVSFTVVSFVLGCVSAPGQRPSVSNKDERETMRGYVPDPKSQLVYELIMKGYMSKTRKLLIVVEDETSIFWHSYESVDGTFKNQRAQLKKYGKNDYSALFDSYVEANSKKYAFSKDNKIANAEYKLLSDVPQNPDAKQKDYWGEFYRAVPTACGILEFSAIGFDDKKNLALVYAGFSRGSLAGSGSFFVVRLSKEEVEVVDIVGIWES
jgi:hypothetical protein